MLISHSDLRRLRAMTLRTVAGRLDDAALVYRGTVAARALSIEAAALLRQASELEQTDEE